VKLNKHWFLLVVLLSITRGVDVDAQSKMSKAKNPEEGVISFDFTANAGHTAKNEHPRTNPFTLFFKEGRLHLVANSGTRNEQIYTDYLQNAFIKVITVKNKHLTQISSFEGLLIPLETGDTLSVAGRLCHKFVYAGIADTLSTWVWLNTTLRGSPDERVTPERGVVLAVDRNRKRLWEAKQIVFRKVTAAELSWPTLRGPYVSAEEYQNAINENNKILIPLINHTLIAQQSETNPSFDHTSFTEKYARGNLLIKKIKVPLLKKSDRVFLKLSSYSNGDPMPRAGSVFLISPGKKANFLSLLKLKGVSPAAHRLRPRYPGVSLSKTYSPQVELMRFTTPYGVRFYNTVVVRKGYHWADSAIYRQDISDVKDLMGKEAWLGIFVAGGDSRGNMVDLSMEIYPEDSELKSKQVKEFVQPLVFTVNPLAATGGRNDEVFQSDSIALQFMVPEGVTNLRLRYIGTSGQAADHADHTFDENEIRVDDEVVAHFVPFRSDCGSFRALNPTSPVDKFGSFESDRSQSGWCPGAITQPIYFPLKELDEGDHSFMVAVPRSKENMPTHEKWQISICLLGDYDSDSSNK